MYSITLRYTYGYGTKVISTQKAAKAYVKRVAFSGKGFLGAACYSDEGIMVFACNFKNGKLKFF